MFKGLMDQIKDGLYRDNPALVQLLGMCPLLATTTNLKNGVGMGLAVIFVLFGSNTVISLLRKYIPSKIRIAAYVVIIAGFVTCIDMVLAAYVPALSKSLGLFIPLIVVNCIILARAESFASKNSVFRSAVDGIMMGAGYGVALVIVSFIREILGNGTFYGIPLFGQNFQPAITMILPPGGFLALGVVIAAMNYLMSKKGGKA
jgi:electron transport complex protein RnfE